MHHIRRGAVDRHSARPMRYASPSGQSLRATSTTPPGKGKQEALSGRSGSARSTWSSATWKARRPSTCDCLWTAPCRDEDEDTAMFRFQDTYVFLQRGAAHDDAPSGDVLTLAQNGVGQFVIFVEDVDAVHGELDQHQVAVLSAVPSLTVDWGMRTLTFADPRRLHLGDNASNCPALRSAGRSGPSVLSPKGREERLRRSGQVRRPARRDPRGRELDEERRGRGARRGAELHARIAPASGRPCAGCTARRR